MHRGSFHWVIAHFWTFCISNHVKIYEAPQISGQQCGVGAYWSSTSLYQCIGRKCFQNPQIFATNHQTFSRAIYFSADAANHIIQQTDANCINNICYSIWMEFLDDTHDPMNLKPYFKGLTEQKRQYICVYQCPDPNLTRHMHGYIMSSCSKDYQFCSKKKKKQW
jgi:hypothetical protein